MKSIKNSRFQKGSGAYTCTCCKRKTRATGGGDNEHLLQCAQCYELAGYENLLSDNGSLSDSEAQHVAALLKELEAKGVSNVTELFSTLAARS